MGKPFKDTTVGKMLVGAASMINPALGNVLNGVLSPINALAEISKADISQEDKLKLQELIFEQQNKEIEEISNRWNADSISDSWLSKNVRPMILIWCIVGFYHSGDN
jgi:hypothetical protein